MVRHFVRLKLRLLSNRLRTQSIVGTIGYIAIWAAGVVGGVLGGLAVFGLGRLSGEPGLMLILAYTAVFIGWMILPASISALDESLDPRRFELLPITPRGLTAGLLVAGAVAPGGVGTLIGLSIATFASFPDWSLVPVLSMAVVLGLAMCLVVARLVTTFLANLLASRRTRELATLLVAVGFAVVALLPAWLGRSDELGSADVEITINSLAWVQTLAWTPPGALARSVVLASEGAFLGSLGLILYGAVSASMIGLAWSKSVRRMLVTAPTSGRQGRRRRLDRTLALTPRWLKLTPGPVLGVVAKELRYLVRDNRVRSQLVGSLVSVVVIAIVSPGAVVDTPYAPFLAVAIAFLIILGILANQFGFDGGSFWAYVVSPEPLATVVRGKNLGWSLVALPPVVAFAIALAVWSGHFDYLAAAVLGAVGVLFVSSAIGNFNSIYGAYRIPENNPFGSRNASGAAFFAVILSMMVSGLLMVPLAVLIGLPAVWLGPAAATVGALVGVGYGIVVYRVAMRMTSRLLVERQHLLLETIDRELG